MLQELVNDTAKSSMKMMTAYLPASLLRCTPTA